MTLLLTDVSRAQLREPRSVGNGSRFRAIFSFHLLRIYGADLLCLVYDGGSDIPRICFVQLIILASSSAPARTLLELCKFSIRQEE